MSTTVTSKGQVTIPKKVRDYLGIRPGTSVDFLPEPGGRVMLVKQAAAARGGKRRRSRFEAIRGSATVRMSTEEIMALTRGED